MFSFYLTLAASLGLAIVFVGLFIKATKSGQWEDVETPALRPLMEDWDERQSKSKADPKR